MITRQYTGDIASPSMRPLGSWTNAKLLMSTKHLGSGEMLLLPNNDSIHTTVQVHLDNASFSLPSACWEKKYFLFLAWMPLQKSGIVAGNREHISLFQIYQLYRRWNRDDPTPVDWWHTMRFPGTTLRALLCSLGLLGVGTTSSTFISSFHACAQEYSRIRKNWGANYLPQNYFQFLHKWAIKECNAGTLMVLMVEDSSTVWRQWVFNCYILISGFTQDNSCHIISVLLPAVLLMVMVNQFLSMNWVTSFYFLLRWCYINLELNSEQKGCY